MDLAPGEPLETLELRWFEAGAPADRVPPEPAHGEVQELRDVYAPAGADCGIKLRGDRLEAKLRQPRRVTPREPTTGRPFQCWTKWSLPVAPDAVPANASWVTVTKRRHLTVRQRDGLRIQFERATVEAFDRVWTSVGLECSGDLDRAGDAAVLATFADLLQPTTATLAGARCWSYPEWLADNLDAVPNDREPR